MTSRREHTNNGFEVAVVRKVQRRKQNLHARRAMTRRFLP
jgi:hypothetical protein